MIDSAALLSRVALTVIFGYSAFAKLRRPSITRRAAGELGVPAGALPFVALLPVVELAIGIGLTLPAGSKVAAAGGLLLLVAFSLLLGWNLRAGRRPACACFGESSSSPISWGSVVRNGVLGLACVVILSAPDPLLTPTQVVEEVERLGVGGSTLALLSLLNLAVMLYTSAAAPRRVAVTSGSEVARPLALGDLRVLSPDGSTPTLQDVGAGRNLLVLFVESSCTACEALLPEVADWERNLEIPFLLIAQDGAEGFDASGAAAARIYTDLSGVRAELNVRATPAAVLLDPERLPLTPVHHGAREIGALVGGLLARPSELMSNRELVLGDNLPVLEMEGVDGRLIGMFSDIRPTVLLFWSTDCPFCDELAPYLERWSSDPHARDVRLVLVSRQAGDGARRISFPAEVVVDEGFVTSRGLHSGATPAALLVDVKGRVGARAEGVAEILTMLDRLVSATAAARRFSDLQVTATPPSA